MVALTSVLDRKLARMSVRHLEDLNVAQILVSMSPPLEAEVVYYGIIQGPLTAQIMNILTLFQFPDSF